MELRSNTIELLFNFHKRYERGNIQDDGSGENYIKMLATEETPFENLVNRQYIYSSNYIKNVSDQPFDYTRVITTQYTSPAQSKTRFGAFFIEGVSKNMMPFPLGLIDFSALDNFKGASNITGRICIWFDQDHFVLEGDFATLPPATLDYYNPSYQFTTNLELAEIVGKISERFLQVEELK